ncbi:MAG: 2Fe-2S iron-sulfur cluster-binding protein [Caulobacteraceae bacterium]
MKVVIDGNTYDAVFGEYILNVAKRNGIEIPALCHNEALPGLGSCRLCIVEVIENSRSKVVASCLYPITRSLEVATGSEKIIAMRRTILKLLLGRASGNRYLRQLAQRYGVALKDAIKSGHADNECILCGLCVKACEEVGISAISTVGRGIEKKVSTPYDEPSSECIGCGACAGVCPTEAIKAEDKDGIREIWGKSFELIKCKGCGGYFATTEYLEYLREKLGSDNKEEYCCSCRKVLQADKFRDIFGIF